ncbi:glucosyltransferase domain-containing protein [Sodalis ligni]|uniref:glucosyltransferase domain-containing protein n=1 Tax=Sodalis ligni TaxID=2697027 RepID=UPI001049BCB4|nr:glucosyltransferase domain-containing protein [Sodalis ligni]
MIKQINFYLEKDYPQKKSFWLCLLLCGLFAFPILYADIYYIDDVSRSQKGLLGWSGLGRPLSDFALKIFNLNKGGLLDVSPLPLILSIFVIAACSMLIAEGIFKRYNVKTLLLSMVCIVCPVLLQNLAYRFDSLPMTLALLFAILAWKILDKSTVVHSTLAVILLFLSLSLYQPCAAVFPILIVAKLMVSSYSKKIDSGYYIPRSLLVFIFSYFFIMY